MPAGDASAGAPTAEQLLVLGRLCSALATESRYLQVRVRRGRVPILPHLHPQHTCMCVNCACMP